MEAGGRVSASTAAERICGSAATRRKQRWLNVQSLPEQVRNPLPPWDPVAAGSFFFSCPAWGFKLSEPVVDNDYSGR
jgi:hypothetical protein